MPSREKSPPTRVWYLLLGVIGVGSRQRVPFLTETTCRRMADEATSRTGRPMRVFRDRKTGGWSYQPTGGADR